MKGNSKTLLWKLILKIPLSKLILKIPLTKLILKMPLTKLILKIPLAKINTKNPLVKKIAKIRNFSQFWQLLYFWKVFCQKATTTRALGNSIIRVILTCLTQKQISSWKVKKTGTNFCAKKRIRVFGPFDFNEFLRGLNNIFSYFYFLDRHFLHSWTV